MSILYSETKNYKKAYDNHVIYKALNDSIYNEENMKKITGLEYKYQFEKEKQAIELEQQKKDAIHDGEVKRQIIVRNSFIAGFVMVLLLVAIVYRNFLIKRKANIILEKQRNKIRDKNIQLRALNAIQN